LNYPLNSTKKWGLAGVFFITGMLEEWIGVHYGFLFGEYYYGENLGLKIDGVPWLIGINWAMLVLITGAIASKISGHFFWKIFWGAMLMVVLGFFMEVSAPVFDFWIWETEGAPVRNYIAWFVIAGMLHFLYQRSKIQGDTLFSFHLYAAQFVFFAYFYGVHSF
jgi:putative membrane protein